MPELPDDIARINALTTNARNTWFALLGVLVFVGITLMSVEHIDFYGVDRATQLPLVNVEVPTRYFFYASPCIIAAIYCYFQLYLIRLWDAVSDAEAQHDGRPLGDIISPWLVTDAALQLRRKLRDEDAPCNAQRTMESPAMLLNIALAWVFGLAILYRIWWQSMPTRDILITGVASLCFLASFIVGAASFFMLLHRMRLKRSGPSNLRHSAGFIVFLAVTFAFVSPLTWLRTIGSYEKNNNALARLAPLKLIREEIVKRPENWLPFEFARKEYRAGWCEREDITDCANLGEKEKAFVSEWQIRRSATLKEMRRPNWHKHSHSKPNFVGAKLKSSFLAGANLGGAQLKNAILRRANLEGASLRRANLNGANFGKAHLENATLRRAKMKGTIFVDARLYGVDFSLSLLTGSAIVENNLKNADISAATNDGGALRNIDLSSTRYDANTDFRNAFLDGSVIRTEQFDMQMGNPCQWWPEIIDSDEEFYGRWRGWVEHPTYPQHDEWGKIAPIDWKGVKPILPPEGCAWKTGPMPGAED